MIASKATFHYYTFSSSENIVAKTGKKSLLNVQLWDSYWYVCLFLLQFHKIKHKPDDFQAGV